MYKWTPLVAIAAGSAALKVPMNSWLRLALELGLGLAAIIWLARTPRQHS